MVMITGVILLVKPVKIEKTPKVKLNKSSSIMIKRNTSDVNWTTGVHFVATVQYTKASS